MSYSKQINELRANNWRTLSSLTAQSSELGRLEAAQHTETARLWNLLGEKGTKAISGLHAIHQENRIAQAHSDFMMWKMQGFLDSDEAKVASADLLNGETVNRQFETALADKAKEMPYDMITKANKLGGAYRATLHKLHLGQLAQRYPAEMRSMMLKSTERLTLPDGTEFVIKDAEGLEQKMAAHNYLRNRFFSTHGVTSNGYTQAFLALSPEQGGSGFYQSIMAHETGKNGMFAQYETNAAIAESFKDQMTMYQAFMANPSAETFGSWYRSIAMGVNEKGNKYLHAGAHKKVREQLKVLAETGQLKFNQIQQIQEAKFNINGVDMTAKELWPKYFGENGELSRSYMEGVRKGSEEALTGQQVMFEQDSGDLIDRITNDDIVSEEQLAKELSVLQSKYTGQEYDYTAIYNHWRKNKFIEPALVTSRVQELITMSKNNRLITKAVANEHNDITSHPAIQKILNEEKVFLENNISEEIIKGLAGDFKGKLVTDMGLPSWEASTASGQIAFDHKLGLYLKYLKEGESSQLARVSAEEEWNKLNGNDKDYRKNWEEGKKENAIFYQTHDGHFPNLMAQYKDQGEDRGKYSAYITSAQIMNNITPEYYPGVKQQILENGGGPVAALSERVPAFVEGDQPGPKIPLEFEGTVFPEGVDYNKYIEETGNIPVQVSKYARDNGLSIVEFINARQRAHGKPELSKDIMDELGDSQNIQNLDWAVRRALFGSDTDGYIDAAAEVSRGSENPTESYEQATGDIAFGEITESIFGSQGSGDAYSYKFHTNVPIALAASFSPGFDLDFTEGGRELFVEKFAQMSPEDKMNLVWSNPNIGEKMFDLTGDLKTYPLVPGLQGSQFDIDNQNAVYTAISQNVPTYDTGEDFTTDANIGTTETTTQPEEQTEATPEVTPEVVPEKKEVSLKQAKKIAKGIETHPVFDNWADSGLDQKSHLIERVEIALLNALNGDISDIDPELLDWVQPFLEQFNIDNTITE